MPDFVRTVNGTVRHIISEVDAGDIRTSCGLVIGPEAGERVGPDGGDRCSRCWPPAKKSRR